MAEILHKILIKAPKSEVYRALSTVEGLAGWWTKTTGGESAPGKTLEFRFNQHVVQMRVEALESGNRVVWRCLAATPEWLDTELSFELSEEAGRTTLLFGHRAWKEPTPFLAHCSMKWATFLLSLRDYVESGAGQPFPLDIAV
jgi:uncharacterized protein YndB with AHSA1/START domain